MTPRAPGWRLAGRWFDPLLAAAFLIVCEAEVITDILGDHSHHHWPLAANILIVAGLAIPLVWRRRAPLISLIAVKASVLVLSVSLADIQTVNFPQLVLFIAPYSVAAYSPRSRALPGLAISIAAISAVNVLSPSGASSWVFSFGVCSASWITGRIMRAHRALAAELERTSDRITAEREGRELLAIAEQRTSIARELQTLVANSVSTMIVQTQAAQRLLDQDSDEADAAMATIEDTGRHALTEMRRILGVLRHTDEHAELAPRPGIGQIPALVEKARHTQRHVSWRVEGDPGPLPASVDLAVYRILEDALSGVDDTTKSIDIKSIDILLRFGADDIELNVTLRGFACLDWPTIAMRERAALCQGVVDVDTIPSSGERLMMRLPRLFEGALP